MNLFKIASVFRLFVVQVFACVQRKVTQDLAGLVQGNIIYNNNKVCSITASQRAR